MKTRNLLFVTLLSVMLIGPGRDAAAQTICPGCWWWWDFAFQPGNDLPGQTEINGITWAAAGPAGPQITIASDSLAVAGLAASAGNKARLAGVDGPAARIGLGSNFTTGTLYYSLLVSVADLGALGTNGGTLAGFNDTTGASPNLPAPVVGRLVVRAGDGGYQLGLSASSGNPADFWWWDEWLFAPNDTVFIVASYTFNAGLGNDTARLWVNPAAATFGDLNPPPADLTATASTDIGQIASFVLMQRPQPILPAITFVDEGRVGMDWASVTPPAMADLAISSSLSPIVVTENIARNLMLTCTNGGPTAATGVQLSVALPAGLRAASATNSAGTLQVTSSNVICSLDTLASNGIFTVQISLIANVLPESSNESEQLGPVSVALSANEPDLNLANNTLSLPVTVFVRLDWGDARGGFPVTRAGNGARHRYQLGYRLGALWDSEGDGVESPASWDDGQQFDDEDGVTFVTTPLIAGAQAIVIVNSAFAGFLDAWVDFNDHSDWANPGEQIFTNQPLAVGDNTLTFTVPLAVVTDNITTRWRASTTGGLSYTGYGGKGEVEDHLVQVQTAPSVDLRAALLGVPIEAEIAGQQFRFTAAAYNPGPNTAYNVSLVIAHQGLNVAIISVIPSGGSFQVSGQQVKCSVNQLLSGQSVAFVLTVTPQASGKLVIEANADSLGAEVNSADNVALKVVPVISSVADCACSCFDNAPPSLDVMLASWFTDHSGQYAKIDRGDGSGTAKWEAGPTATAMDYIVENKYADVQRIQYDANWVYITANGLASYIMGPWSCEPGNPFPTWPDDQTRPFKFPRVLDVSACTDTGLDAIGLWVNGTAIYNMLDGFYFDPNTDSADPMLESDIISADRNQADAMPGPMTAVWNRDAWYSEKDTFDSGKFHTAQGQYHSHANPYMLRLQLQDNLPGGVEQPNPAHLRHSPILGWAFDGHPIYGPYGYSEATNSGSPITRMRSGYVPRNGLNGTTDLNSTGRTTLPTWARMVQGFTTSVLNPTTQYGPPTDRTPDRTECNDILFTLGRYAEDNAYLGHLINPVDGDWFHQGEDFDLDLHNGRCCVTPEFPNGTYAYIVTIDDLGVPAFPYVLGWQFCGKPIGGENASADGIATIYFWSKFPDISSLNRGLNGLHTAKWKSLEGAFYRLHSSPDLQHWTPVSPSLPSGGTTSSYTFDLDQPLPPQQFFKVELERDGSGPSQANP